MTAGIHEENSGACPYRLRSCVWEITLACCFSCRYCGSSGGKARESELTTAECLDVAHQLAALGCRRVSLIGGEVFMRRDWEKICLELSQNGISVNIITNGFVMTPEIISGLKRAGAESVSVSLDGPRDVHDRYRQKGSFDRAVSALRTLADADIPVSVITTLNAENAEYLEELYETVRRYPLYAWQLQACSPMGNAAKYGIDWKFDFGRVIGFVEKTMKTAPFAVGVADNIGYFTPGEGKIRGDCGGDAVFAGCSAGLTTIGIDSAGNVRGCESMYDECFNEGNLREKSLAEIWENPEGFAYNRRFTPDMLTGVCSGCPMGPYCAGGCRSYNYFTCGRLYESACCAGRKEGVPL